MHSKHTWALVLAGGEGRRLQGMTTDSHGVAIPKQYCALAGDTSMLQETIQRAERIAPRERVLVIVAAQHSAWWRQSLRGFPQDNVVIQPQARGTGVGILLPLLTILNRDPDASIVLLPSDHHIRRERIVRCGIQQALVKLASSDSAMVLLGITPDRFDQGLGYIVPGSCTSDGSCTVQRFVEKPGPELSHELTRARALWNSFIVAIRGKAVLDLFAARFPGVVNAMISAVQSDAARDDGGLARLYETLPDLDFSRHVVIGAEQSLRVIPIKDCGWSDLGTPERVAKCLATLVPGSRNRRALHAGASAFLSLADVRAGSIYTSLTSDVVH